MENHKIDINTPARKTRIAKTTDNTAKQLKRLVYALFNRFTHGNIYLYQILKYITLSDENHLLFLKPHLSFFIVARNNRKQEEKYSERRLIARLQTSKHYVKLAFVFVSLQINGIILLVYRYHVHN